MGFSPRGNCLDFKRCFFHIGSLASARTGRIRDPLWENLDLLWEKQESVVGESGICLGKQESVVGESRTCCGRIRDLLWGNQGSVWETTDLLFDPVTTIHCVSSLPRPSLYFLDRQQKRMILHVFPSLL